MPVIKINKKELQKLSNLTEDKIIELIPMIGAEIEKVSEDNIHIEFFPNRPDLYSIEGITRALKSFSDANFELNNYNIENNNEYKIYISNDTKNVRPFIIGAIIKNITINNNIIESFENLIENLHWALGRNKRKISINIHDIVKLKFPLTYKIINTNDYSIYINNKLTNLKYIEDKVEYKKYKNLIYNNLNKLPGLLDNENSLLSIPGLIQNSKTKISNYTTSLFIEVTGNHEDVKYALNIITAAFADRNGKIESISLINENNIIIKAPSMEPIITTINNKDIEKIIGIDINNDNIIKCLRKMGHNAILINKNDSLNDNILVKTPSYRSDILDKRDIIEDIAIGYGYQNIESKKLNLYSIGEESRYNKIKNKLLDIMIGIGFLQVLPFTLSN